jgi:hypothetical protein
VIDTALETVAALLLDYVLIIVIYTAATVSRAVSITIIRTSSNYKIVPVSRAVSITII